MVAVIIFRIALDVSSLIDQRLADQRLQSSFGSVVVGIVMSLTTVARMERARWHYLLNIQAPYNKTPPQISSAARLK